MEIVIDIPEEYFRVRKSIQNGSMASKMILDSLKNGIPLPEGHGDLVDRDALESTTIVTDDFSSNVVLDVVLVEDLMIAPTIVEADRGAKMKIEILKCFENDGVVYGEYYITDDDGKYLCFQNGNDIQLLVHWQGKSVKDCITKPTKKVVDMVLKTSKEYLSTDLKFESVALEVKDGD